MNRRIAACLAFSVIHGGCTAFGPLPIASAVPPRDTLLAADIVAEPDAGEPSTPVAAEPTPSQDSPASTDPTSAPAEPPSASSPREAPSASTSTSGDVGPAPDQPASDAKSSSSRDEGRISPQRQREITFWTGIGAVALGTAGVIVFGSVGYVAGQRLDDAYAGSLSHEREERLQSLGQTMHGLGIGSAVVAILGVGLTTIAFSLDHVACGKLSGKRRRADCRS